MDARAVIILSVKNGFHQVILHSNIFCFKCLDVKYQLVILGLLNTRVSVGIITYSHAHFTTAETYLFFQLFKERIYPV